MFEVIYEWVTGGLFAIVVFLPMLVAIPYMFKEGKDD